MKRFHLIACAACLAACAARGQAPAAAAPATSPLGEVTVITSERLTFDYKSHYAVFEGNVQVTDPEMQLSSDRLTVQFDESGAAQVIKADGRVTITQADKTTQSQVATYDVATGKIVLAGQPRVTRGRDTLEGDVITYWRNDDRMVCQPRARLVIYPEKGGVKDSVRGD